jgi:hypothetical protein
LSIYWPLAKKNFGPIGPFPFIISSTSFISFGTMDSFIAKTFSFNISRVTMDMSETVTMEEALQSCRGFVQSK